MPANATGHRAKEGIPRNAANASGALDESGQNPLILPKLATSRCLREQEVFTLRNGYAPNTKGAPHIDELSNSVELTLRIPP